MNLGELDKLVTETCEGLDESIATKMLVKASTTDGLCRYRITGVKKAEGNEGFELVFVLQS